MTLQPLYRQYVIFRRNEDLVSLYRLDKLAPQQAFSQLENFTRNLLTKMGVPPGSPLLQPGGFRVVSAPSLDWRWEIVGLDDAPPEPDELIISYGFTDPALLDEFRGYMLKFQGQPVDGVVVLAIGADVGADRADHWCPGSATAAMFGDRDEAHRVLNIDVLRQNQLRGRRVNVVIVDEGLDRNVIPAANWGGGLISVPAPPAPPIPPGSAPRTSHGMLIASNVLDISPDAVLYDVPLIPRRITNIPVFVSDAHAVYSLIQILIWFLRQLPFPRWHGPWMLVNAWAIFDRSSELPTLGDYTENTHPGGHPFNNIVGAITQNNVDIVFAAGNCGQFCPNRRCGKLDRGPGHSIWGANAHFAVITVGAARTDELWLGYSSQGPGPGLLRRPGQPLPNKKPDLCAPSQFNETTDAYVEGHLKDILPMPHPRTNTGTSTSCALTAGVVAALRSNPNWDQFAVTPDAFKQRLIETTRKTKGPDWNDRLGWGILDAGSAYDRLLADFP